MIWASAPSSVQFGELKAEPETGAETHAEARRTRREKLPRRRVRVRGLHRAWLLRIPTQTGHQFDLISDTVPI